MKKGGLLIISLVFLVSISNLISANQVIETKDFFIDQSRINITNNSLQNMYGEDGYGNSIEIGIIGGYEDGVGYMGEVFMFLNGREYRLPEWSGLFPTGRILFGNEGQVLGLDIDLILISDDNSTLIAKFWIWYDDVTMTGVIIEDNEERISALESNMSLLQSWKQTMEDWKIMITDIISEFTLSITGLITKTDEYETRISNLENQNFSQSNITISDYWKYMSSSDRKNIVCGVAIDNHLTTLTMQELGYRCDVTYRQTSRGEKASCRCDKI